MKKERLLSIILIIGMGLAIACGPKQETVNEVVNNAGEVSVVEESETSKPLTERAGVYVYNYSEEFDGQMIELSDMIKLNEDNSCEVTFQDTIPGTWNENEISLDSGSVFQIKFEENELLLNRDGIWISFIKE